jgi:hypothetical protein
MFGRRDKGSGETCAACATTEDFAREGAAIASAAHDLLECHPISGRRNFINIESEPKFDAYRHGVRRSAKERREAPDVPEVVLLSVCRVGRLRASGQTACAVSAARAGIGDL